MSARIHQTIAVIEEVHTSYRLKPKYKSIWSIRNDATKDIAVELGFSKQTVESKFITQMKPDIKDAHHFDELLENWLLHDSNELKKILLKYAVSEDDRNEINKVFFKAPDSDLLLAQEFGYDPADDGFKEGKIKLRIHLVKERKRNLVEIAKREWNQKYNKNIRCFICSFSFKDQYGQLGEDFIEAHHIQPISTIVPDTIIKVSDLIPVCSNCHSMLHRHNSFVTVEQLQSIVAASNIYSQAK